MAHAVRSAVWTYFEILEDDNSKAICKVCQEKGSRIVISRGEKTCKQFTTTNLRNHLRKHPKEFLALSADEKEKNVAKGKRTQQDMDSSTVTMRKKLKTQMSLQQSIEAGQTWDSNSRQAQHITKLIGEMIALDNQPFPITKDLGFMRLMKHVAPRYHLPSRQHFSDTVIPNLVKRAEAAVAKMLEKAKHFSFTSDIWTCSHTNNAFISLTAHWIDEHETKVPRQSIVLQSSFFQGSHNGERIAEKFESMLSKWTIDHSRCHIVVTDNASNITNAVELAGLMGSPCFIHTLQLAINDAIFSQRSVSDMIAKAKRIVTHFRHSALGSSRLAEIQDDLGLPKKKLIQDVATRWNSTYYMLDRLLENKRAVTLYSAETPTTTLSPNEWSLMEKVLRLLQPFEEYTKLMSNDNSCISEVIPAVTVLKKFLSRDDGEKTAGVRTMRDELSSALERRFQTAFSNKNFVLATTIDPRFKTKFSKDEGRSMLVNECHVQGSSESDMVTSNTKETVTVSRRDGAHQDLWSCFEEIVASESGDNVPNLEEEVNAFLGLPLQPLQSCPYTWWVSNKQMYPNIFNIALKYLSPPSSSVYSERVFSEAGNISTDKRSRLAPHKADNILFLHHNLPKLNFDY